MILRATWDYTERLPEFLDWARAVPQLLNSADVVAWNVDKRYLHDLAVAGVRVVESEFFGHEAGAFTSAMKARVGKLEHASGGTLFLDEVGELSARAQAKLLRAIQEGEIRRVGENTPRRVDVRLVAATVRGVFTPPYYRHDIIEQLDVIGLGSLVVVLLTGFFTGAALASQTGLTLDQFGARPIVGRLVSTSMVIELGPVLTALMLTGRIGSGIAAELGSMVVTDQINALRALGTDPVRKLVVPRVLAGFLMAPVLTIIADFVGIFGGWVVARFQLQVASGGNTYTSPTGYLGGINVLP